MSRSKLLGRLNTLMEPSPASVDPEDMADFDGTSATNKKRMSAGGKKWGLGDENSSNDSGSDEDKSGGVVHRSKLRDDAAMAASEWGERYASTKVSRKQLKAGNAADDDEDDDDDDDEDISSEDAEEEDGIDEDEDGEDDDESEEDLSDPESEGSNESGEDASIGPEQASVFAGVGADNVDAQLAALAAEDRAGSTTGSKSTAQGGVGSSKTSGQSEGIASTDQRQRAKNAKALLALYDSVFEFRIAQQAAVHATNQLPAPTELASMLAPPKVEQGGDSAKATAAGTPGSKKRNGSKTAGSEVSGVIATTSKASGSYADAGAAGQGQQVAMRKASQQLQSTLQHLCALREDLRAGRQKRNNGSLGGGLRSEAPVDCAPKNSKRRRFDENGDEQKGSESEEEDEDDEKGNGAATKDCLLSGYSDEINDGNTETRTRARAIALESTWDGVAAGFERSKPFWEATLEQWQRRAQVGGLTASSKKSFKVVNRPLFEQAAAALATRDSSTSSSAPLAASHTTEEAAAGAGTSSLPERALRKVHPPRADDATDSTGVDATTAGTASLNMAVLDDKEFYHSQLREFLAARGPSLGGGGGSDGYTPVLDGAERAAAAVAAAARRRRTRRHGVDTKASKGRKLRYDVMPKLENFMFPVPPPEPPHNVAELFGSLFGGQHNLAASHA